VLAELELLPGVHSVSIGGAGMLSGNGYNTTFAVDGYTPAAGEEMRAAVVLAGPRFFETLRGPLLRGREFTLADEPHPAAGGPTEPATVVILGETMARRFFGDADPIGRHITITQWTLSGVRLEVIGVAKDTKYSRNLREQTPLEFYVAFFGGGVRMPLTFYVRSAHSAAAIAAGIHSVVTRIEPRVTIRDLRTMDEVIDRLLVRERIIAQLAGFFSVFALLLASLGIYGLLSYSVAQRTQEVGVRMALGATVQDVVRLVIRQGLTLALFGCALGIGAALIATRFIATLLYGVQPADPLTFAAVTGLLMAVALTACWLPARRAAKVDPMVALRTE
jgi:predicted permease